MKKSSQKVFVELTNIYDNSMGSYNNYIFDFIDSKGLQSEFRDYLLSIFKQHIHECGFTDGECGEPKNKLFAKSKVKEYREEYLSAYKKGKAFI